MKKWYTVILILILIAGFAILLYPSVSNFWNAKRQSYMIADYAEEISDMDEQRVQDLFDAAHAYNQRLAASAQSFFLTDEQLAEYNSVLDVSGTGIMGYIEIPKIDVTLPVYHSVDDSVLQFAMGHIPGSSLPVGGTSTHAVMSGHTGLPSAKLISDLDQMELGDVFRIRILDQELLYQVDQILVLLPHETEELLIVDGMDYCTLVTCTPVGVNTHRLLVRGVRIDNIPENSIVFNSDAAKIDPLLVMPFIAAPLLLVLFLWVMFSGKKKRRSSDAQ